VAEAQLLPVLGLDCGRQGGSRTFLDLGVLFLYVSNNVLTKVLIGAPKVVIICFATCF
jgi:hypothetical protein